MTSVAVIIPVRNEERMLAERIECLSSLGADEIVIVDGGSSDHSLELLQASGLRWLTSEPGRAVQMNAGAATCEADILLFLHIDTTLDSSHIARTRQAMRDERVVGGRFDVRLSGRYPALRIVSFFINLRSRLSRISTGDQAMFVRRSLFERLGGFPRQPLMEDIELSRRLKRAGKIACLRDRVESSSRRWEERGIVRTVLLMWWLRLRYRLGAEPAALKRHYRDSR